jgi:hypothetical protein
LVAEEEDSNFCGPRGICKLSAGINRHVGVSSEGWRIQWEAVPPGQESGTL